MTDSSVTSLGVPYLRDKLSNIYKTPVALGKGVTVAIEKRNEKNQR